MGIFFDSCKIYLLSHQFAASQYEGERPQKDNFPLSGDEIKEGGIQYHKKKITDIKYENVYKTIQSSESNAITLY